jgi:hypothetical protein
MAACRYKLGLGTLGCLCACVGYELEHVVCERLHFFTPFGMPIMHSVSLMFVQDAKVWPR